MNANQNGSQKSILVVDDSATMRRMVMASLRTLPGVSFEQAGSGLEAIERLGLGRVSLVLLDLNMPDIHGLEVLRFMRNHQAYSEIPVIILSTRCDESARTAALANGATRYLTKPFQPLTLAEEVRAVLSPVSSHA